MAYTRWSKCKVCKQEFFYTSDNTNGAKRTICDECKTKHTNAMNNERVKRHRKAHDERNYQVAQHIGSKELGRTWCGLPLEKVIPANVIKRHSKDMFRMCAKCERIQAAMAKEAARASK